MKKLSMSKSAVKSRKYRLGARYREKVKDPEWRKHRAEMQAKWRANNPDKIHGQRERELARIRWLRLYHRDKYYEKYILKRRRITQRERMLKAVDATYAEFCRAKHREENRRHRDKTRKRPYRPLFSMRIPPDLPFGVNPIDKTSRFLRNNALPDKLQSFDDFDRCQKIEIRNWRTKNGR